MYIHIDDCIVKHSCSGYIDAYTLAAIPVLFIWMPRLFVTLVRKVKGQRSWPYSTLK